MPEIALCDRFDAGFGWIEAGGIRRCAHALAREGQVWLVDPFAWDGLDAAIEPFGVPAGVIQLLDRHARDGEVIARRLGVPLHRPYDGAELPFARVPILRRRFWLEEALWWEEQRVLVCADALGTVGYFRAAREEVGVHPFLRLTPPRRLAGLRPAHLLVGHGEGLHGDAVPQQLAEALRTARRRLPAAFVHAFRSR